MDETSLDLANPYYSAYAWWWDDEMGHAWGPYETQTGALRALMEHIASPLPHVALWRLAWELLKAALRQK